MGLKDDKGYSAVILGLPGFRGVQGSRESVGLGVKMETKVPERRMGILEIRTSRENLVTRALQAYLEHGTQRTEGRPWCSGDSREPGTPKKGWCTRRQRGY